MDKRDQSPSRDMDGRVATYLVRISVCKVRPRDVPKASLFAFAGAAVALLGAIPVATAAERPSRIIDRTVVCTMAGTGFPDPVRIIDASATPRIAATEASPTTNVTNGEQASGSVVGAGVRTGRAPIGSGPSTGEVRVSDAKGTRCRRTTLRIPLSAKGLRGGPAREIGNSYKCNVPARVLIRVRAVFKRPTSFKFDTRFKQAVANGEITAGYLAVAPLRSQKPIIFTSVHGPGGTAKIFAAPGCVESQ